MRIGKQTADVINNFEYRVAAEVLHRDVQDLLALVRRALDEGVLDDRRAAALKLAAGEVGRAVNDDGPQSSRFRRAVENLKHVASAVTATAGIAQAAETIVRTVASP